MRKTPRKAARGGACRDDRDPQRRSAYAWEDTWPLWHVNTHTLAECRFIIRVACKRYGIAPPAVRQHGVRSLSWCIAEEDCISLQAAGPRGRGGKNVPTALHEAAHYIAFKLFGYRIQDHGPTWLGVYLWLLAAARVAPRVALNASARAAGLKWREIHPCKLRAV